MPATASQMRHEPDPPPARSERWARIDASGDGEIRTTTKVAGIPLIVRLARMVARAGWDGVIVSGGDQDAIRAALERWPVATPLRIEYTAGDPAADAADRAIVQLDGCAVYTAEALELPEPEPLARVATRADARRVTRELVARTRKSIDADGIVAYYLFRPISRAMTRALLNTPVTPNAVTLVSAMFGLAGAVLAAIGRANLVALAGVLFLAGAVIDCVDGEMARVRLAGSKVGEWLDTLADDITSYAFLAGLGIGMVRDGSPVEWAWVASLGALVGFVVNFKLYLDLSRWGMVVDTARYPWFFGSPASGDARKSGWSKIIYALNFLVRRDAVATMIAVALGLGFRAPAVIGFLTGIVAYVVMFIVHGIVVSTRHRPAHVPADQPFWQIGFFGIKDVFTVINLLGGVMGIVYAFEGKLDYAGFAIFAGYLLGDVLDGPVARWTGTANKFGREFDAATDHLAQAIAPSVIAYVAFAMGGHQKLGILVLAVLIATASIRQTRFGVATFDYPLTYCGLPRTVSGLIALSLPNSVLFFKNSVLGYEGVAAVLIFVGLLNLCPIPYMTHKGRKMQGYVKPFVAGFLLIPPLMMIFAREFVFDVLFFITFGYALAAWIPLTPDERRAYWAEYKRWSHEVATRK